MRRRLFLAGAAAMFARADAQTFVSNAKALSGARFMSGETEFLLADIIAPPLYTLEKERPPHFEVSRRALQDLLTGALDVEDVLAPTRWGVRRVLAKRTGESETLQERLVAAGAARVRPQTEDHDLIRRLLALEDAARAGRRGLWALPDYRVFDAGKAWGAVGAFHLVEGTVREAGQHGSRFYMNFGEDYRTDFTASAASRLYRRWKKAGTDLVALAGVPVRVRGLVEAINGPSIDLTHFLQVERLD
ncbi:thermonuclease family protein [Hyphococcus luteus]|uniref:TNase-like domain-containing protein n=1 Tax=Hyphococcus luteus TaxID=2058213 RepID=A0A2S7K8U6_9PROT|nr:thermonuclease family protein [Marinicaulis flavus]PQA88908.1 hypothetical protein CW354_02825 [Marinicaulis flavus]